MDVASLIVFRLTRGPVAEPARESLSKMDIRPGPLRCHIHVPSQGEPVDVLWTPHDLKGDTEGESSHH